MKRVVVVPFASRLHGELYYSSVYDVLRSHILRAGVNVKVLPPVTDNEDIESLARENSDAVPVFAVLTGGTSRLMRKFASVANYGVVLFLAHGEHNSLPSAISARVKMSMAGIKTWLLHCREVGSVECPNKIWRAVNIAEAIASLLNSRVLLIGPYAEKPENARDFEKRFNSVVDVMTVNELTSMLESARSDYVEHFLRTFENAEHKLLKNKLIEVAKLYAVIRSVFEERNYDGAALDCFPYLIKYGVTPCLALSLLNAEGLVIACEGDLVALTLMLISKKLSGVSGWIANASMFEDRKAYFAHCTIALNMIKNPVILSHFESGYPYSITGELKNDTYTITSLSPDYSTMIASLGRLVESGMLHESMCRTQAVIDLNLRTEEIPMVAVSNHHVLIPGDVREELRIIASLLGINYAEYRDLIKTT
ncbi:MAG: hypothetical protein QXK60_02425 [Zestosphaera sp.]